MVRLLSDKAMELLTVAEANRRMVFVESSTLFLHFLVH